MTRKISYMDPGLFHCLIQEIYRERLTRNLLFHVYGEPLMHPNFKEFLQKAKEMDFSIILVTNGYLLNEEMGEFLTGILRKDDLISISYKSFVERAYVDHGLPNHTFYQKRINDFIALKVRKRTPVKIALNLMKNTAYNYQLFKAQPDLRRYALKREELRKLRDQITTILPDPAIHAKDLTSFDYFTRMTKIHLAPDILLVLTSIEEIFGDPADTGRHKSRYGYCRGLLDHFTISSAGDVGPCCYQDVNYQINFGNVAETPLSEILKKKTVVNFRESIDRFVLPHPFCRLCKGASSFTALSMRLGVMYLKMRKDRLMFKEPPESEM